MDDEFDKKGKPAPGKGWVFPSFEVDSANQAQDTKIPGPLKSLEEKGQPRKQRRPARVETTPNVHTMSLDPETGKYRDKNIATFKKLFNQGRYFDAKKHMEKACEYRDYSGLRSNEIRIVYRALRKVAVLFHTWEQHRYDESYEKFKAILNDQLINLRIALAHEGPSFTNFLEELKDSDHFKELDRDKKNITRLRGPQGAALTPENEKNQLSYRHVYELLASVKRELDGGKFNEAFVRLYRSIEFVVQIKLYQKYNWSTFGRVNLSAMPKELQGKWSELNGEAPQLYVNLKNGWSILEYYEDPLTSSKASKELKRHLVATAKRNDNILIHGTAVKNEESLLKLWELVKETTGVSDESVFVFPKLGEQPRAIMSTINAFVERLEESDEVVQVIALQRANLAEFIAGFEDEEAIAEGFNNVTALNWLGQEQVLIDRYCERVNDHIQPWTTAIQKHLPDKITRQIEQHIASPETVRETVLEEYEVPRSRPVYAFLYLLLGGPICSAHGFAFGSTYKMADFARNAVVWWFVVFLCGLLWLTTEPGLALMIFTPIFIGMGIAGSVKARDIAKSRLRLVHDVLAEHKNVHVHETLNVFDKAIISLNRDLQKNR